MNSKLLALTLFFGLQASMAGAVETNEIPHFNDGTTVKCNAYHTVGQSSKGHTAVEIEVFYRLDSGMYENAYFRNVPTIGNYSYDGSCSNKVCSLSIRDNRTNTVSRVNASYAKLNDNSVQTSVDNFKENITATLICSLVKKKN